MCIRDPFSSLLGPYATISHVPFFFLTSRKNAAGHKGQAFEASHEEAQVSSGHPKGRVMRTWQSPYEIIGDGCDAGGHRYQLSQRPCSSIYVCIDIHIYKHRYIHTNSNVYIYIHVDQYIYIFSYTSVFTVLHMYTHIHTYTRLCTNTHQGEGVKNRVFTKQFCHYQLLLEIHLTLCQCVFVSFLCVVL